jgi:hypothetical protein
MLRWIDRGLAVNGVQETIPAVLGPDGRLTLAHQPRLPPGPVEVTIRVAAPARGNRALADVIREIAAGQRAGGFPGRAAADVRADDEASQAEDADRERELDAASRT